MGKKILFSPIGTTDPIKYCRDGSMLHICRHYKPDIVYLCLSYEMLEYHRKDNRYVDSVERLGEKLGHTFDIRLIERPDWVNVQEYDVLYQNIREELRKIENEMEEDDELLLNMSSGTPPMKSALLIISTFAEYRIVPIQVSTPARKANTAYDNRDEYEWELNEDNEEGAPNRCTEPRHLNLMKDIKKETIKKHVENYDYNAALRIAEEIRQDISKEAYKLIRAANARIKLNDAEITSILKDKKDEFYPIKKGNCRQIFEYALVLQIKIKRDEIVDFIRGLTPLTADLLENILNKTCNIKLDDLCCKRGKEKTRCWDRKKMQAAGIPEQFEGPIYSHQISKIIEATYSGDAPLLLEQIKNIVKVESLARNMAAHEIVSVTRGWVREKTGLSIDKIFEIIRYLTAEAGIEAKGGAWSSYERMNENIISKL